MLQIITIHQEVSMNFKNKFEVLDYLMTRSMNVKKCFTFIEREMGHLILKCPIVNDMISILGSDEDVSYIYNQLVKRDLWKPGQLTGW